MTWDARAFREGAGQTRVQVERATTPGPIGTTWSRTAKAPGALMRMEKEHGYGRP
jgi:hypothetical protein